MRIRTPANAVPAPSVRPESESDAEEQPAIGAQDGERGERKSRRSFVVFGALAAASLLPKTARAQAKSRQRKPSEPKAKDEFAILGPNENVAAFSEWAGSASRLVRRATLGVTAAEMTRATQMGYQGYLNYQLNHTRIDDSALETDIAAKWPLLSQSSDVLFSADANQARIQLQEGTIYRAAFSQRQLFERMVEFWSDHFNQDMDKVGYLLISDLRDVVRKNALGKFPDLLKASAHSPSMMLYLDQNASRVGAPNQNYAREIMELHTLGVDGGYTQDDVAELSRVLTGWTFSGRGTFTFDPARHDWKAKTVLGVTIPAGSPSLGAAGINEGEQMLDLLVNHPSTARFIATKMLKWLLTPTPSATQISTVAAAYRATGGDIKAMIRVILNDTWLAAAPMKLKRPFHFLVSSMRSTHPTVVTMTTLNGQLGNLGQSLFSWDTPDGYPDKIEYWAGNIVPRWGFGTVMSNLNSTTTITVDTTAYRAGSPDAAVDLIDQNFFGGEMPLVTRTALLTYIKGGTFNDARVRETIGLAISANAFQWY
ncbi:MAG TPA: DUF1800 domain-containing protein [Gemmatimonadaceae bacterium]|nr:DUF1800 domain-containing protein [Gemmatimonadaceae bacterium]